MRKYISLLSVIVLFATSCQKETVPPSTETPESGSETGNESGVMWDAGAKAEEIVNGVKLTLSFDNQTSEFVGTLENLNTTTAPQVRVEVHVFDNTNKSTEYGPTTPADMAPGEKKAVKLSITGATDFVKFNMHPEVGGSGNGEGGEGNGEGGEGNGEGGEGGGGEAGNESGKLWKIDANAVEIVNGIKLSLSYNAASESFEGTLENINTTVSPKVRVEVHVFDVANKSKEYGPTTPGDMKPGETRNVTLPVPGAGNFVTFNMHPEVG